MTNLTQRIASKGSKNKRCFIKFQITNPEIIVDNVPTGQIKVIGKLYDEENKELTMADFVPERFLSISNNDFLITNYILSVSLNHIYNKQIEELSFDDKIEYMIYDALYEKNIAPWEKGYDLNGILFEGILIDGHKCEIPFSGKDFVNNIGTNLLVSQKKIEANQTLTTLNVFNKVNAAYIEHMTYYIELYGKEQFINIGQGKWFPISTAIGGPYVQEEEQEITGSNMIKGHITVEFSPHPITNEHLYYPGGQELIIKSTEEEDAVLRIDFIKFNKRNLFNNNVETTT